MTKKQDLDPRFAKLIAKFAATPELAAVARDFAAPTKRASSFGANALKRDGKIFAMVSRGHLVVKLSKQRVDALVAAGHGTYFDPGHGRLMKQWISITSKKLAWFDLAREAFELAIPR
jgi:hypothetical protein